MTPRLCAAAFGIAILCINIPSTAMAQQAAPAAQQFTLTSQIALRIHQTLQGTLSTADYAQKLTEAIRTVIAGHARAEVDGSLAQIYPSDFSNPAAVAAAIGQIKARLSATAAMAGHLPPPVIHPTLGAILGAPLPPPPPPPTPVLVPHAGTPAPVAAPEAAPPGPVAAPEAPPPGPLPVPDQTVPIVAPPAPSGETPVPPAARPQKFDVKYNAPDTIPLGRATDFRLIIASANVVGPTDFAGAPGAVMGHPIPKVSHVKAVMHGPPKTDVDISSGSAPCQTVSASDNPTWDWAVTPKSTGSFQLHVDILEVGPDCNAPAPVTYRIDNFSIKVTATWWQTLTNGLGTLNTFLTAIFALIAAGGAAFGAWRWLKPGAKD